MNQRSAPHQAIRDLINPPASRRALVVEGPDDKIFIERQFDVAHPGWRQNWVVGPANGKGRALEILKLEPTWLGVVDADEWQPATVAQLGIDLPRLHVLPRYCMESYFIVPAELWTMLPTGKQALINGGLPALEAAVTAPLPQWLRHGALWQVVNPLWAGLRAKGFKDDLLDLNAAQSDQTIQTKLQEWDTFLDAPTRFAEFQANLANAQGMSVENQLKHVVHGKSFFQAHLSRELNSLLHQQKSAADWLTELTKNCPTLKDFAPLWAAMQLP